MDGNENDTHNGVTRQVWHVLTEADAPMTPAQIRDALDGSWAYTTITTVLTRLVSYGAAARSRDGRAYAYVAVADHAGLTARRMSRLLGSGADRAAVLARFVDVLSDEDEKLLGDLLAATRPRDENHLPIGAGPMDRDEAS